MFGGGDATFAGAPVSKGLLLCAASGVLATQYNIPVRGMDASLFTAPSLATPVFLLASQLSFTTATELFTGGLLIYTFRFIERCYGSGRFALLATLAATAGAAAEVSLLALGGRLGFPSGPYSIILATLVPYFLEVPSASTTRVLGVRLSEKSIIYLFSMQLLLSSGRASLVPGLAGLAVGVMHGCNLLGMRKWRIPKVVTQFFASTIGKLVGGEERGVWPPRRRGGGGGRDDRGDEWARQFQQELPPQARPPPERPPPELVERLEAMGFGSDQCIAALQQCDNNIDHAANLLLSGA